MAKQSGLADQFFVDGYDLSGDVGALSKAASPRAFLEVPGLDKSANERIFGLRDGEITFDAYWNDATISLPSARAVLNSMPTVDRYAQYHRGRSVGSPVACLLGRQVNFDWRRTKNAELAGSIQVLGDGYGLEWGEALTAGRIGHSAATNGSSIDGQSYGLDAAISSLFGAAAYLQVKSFAGTTVTVKIQDSADNSAFADIAGMAFTAITVNASKGERIESSTLTTTIRRYVRMVTTGTFSDLQFAVAFVRYLGARDQ